MRPLAICPAIHLRAVRVTAEANALLRLYLEVAIRAVSASGNIEIVHDRSQHVRPDALQAAQSLSQGSLARTLRIQNQQNPVPVGR